MSDAIKAMVSAPRQLQETLRTTIRRIDLASDHVRMVIDKNAMANWLADSETPFDENEAIAVRSRASRGRRANKVANSVITSDDADTHIIDLPLSIRRRGVERRLVIEGQSASLRRLDQPLIDMLARAHAYLEALTDGQGYGRKDVAERFGVHPEDVSRVLPLAFLSPKIVEAILTGQQPADLSVRHLVRGIELPISWSAQGKLLTI